MTTTYRSSTRLRSLSLAAGAALCFLPAAALAANTLHVPSQYPSIQAAVAAALPGDTILVADGVYTGPANKNISFAGKAITLRSQNGPAACIIDCQASAANPHRAFVFDSGETAAAVLDGFTVRNGATPNGAVADQFNGGAVLCAQTASPTIRNCVFESNRAGCWGGAVCSSSSASPTLISCIFRGNFSQDDGGGFFSWSGGASTLINCVFTGNAAPGTGGGVTCFSGPTRLINCTITGNSSGHGAGVYGFNTTLTNCVVRGNTGDTLQIQGGAAVTYSNIQGGATGVGNIDADPLFMSATDSRLRPGSPCIDAGSNAAIPAGIAVDASGSPRFVEDTGVANTGLGTPALVDIGAFEFQGTTCPSDFDHNFVVNPADLAAFVNAWFASLSTGTLAGDADHNGAVTPSDVAFFVSRWFTGC